MVHGIGWMTFAASALLIREAARLIRCQLAYRQQRWILEHVAQATSEERLVDITGLDQITITLDRGRLRTRRDRTGNKRLA